MNSGAPELSIVVPAYNEEERLGRTLSRVHEYFSRDPRVANALEIIVVDDGSTDGTVRVAQEWAERPQMANFDFF